MEQFPGQFPRTSFGPRKHLLVVAMTRGLFCEAPIPLCRDNRVALLCRVPALFECTASVLAVEPRLCTRHLSQGCQHILPSVPHQQAWFPIVTHSQSLKSPVSTCAAMRCPAAHLQPRWLQLIVTQRFRPDGNQPPTALCRPRYSRLLAGVADRWSKATLVPQCLPGLVFSTVVTYDIAG